jgi:hypothetical protein
MYRLNRVRITLFQVAVGLSFFGCNLEGGGEEELFAEHECSSDANCTNSSVCDGLETCAEDGEGTRRCTTGTPITCDDSISCTIDSCSESEFGACVHLAPDVDGDGHGDNTCVDGDGKPLGDDCDDNDDASTTEATDADCDGDVDPPDPLAVAVLAAITDYECEVSRLCETKEGLFSDSTKCHPAHAPQVPDHQVVDADKAAACISALDALVRSCDYTPLPAECESATSGTLAQNARCEQVAECQPGLTCAGLEPGCSGTCQPRTADGGGCGSDTDCLEGSTCTAGLCDAPACVIDDDCTPGNVCTDGGVCGAAPPTEGYACKSFFGQTNCAGDLVCIETPDSGTCQQGVALGEACLGDFCPYPSRCYREPCVPGARCVGGTCRAIADPGGACDQDIVCPATQTCEGGTCAPAPILGEACDGDTPCMDGQCDNDTVCILGAPGAACNGNFQCEGYCFDNICAAAKGVNVTCNNTGECMEGLLCDILTEECIAPICD